MATSGMKIWEIKSEKLCNPDIFHVSQREAFSSRGKQRDFQPRFIVTDECKNNLVDYEVICALIKRRGWLRRGLYLINKKK